MSHSLVKRPVSFVQYESKDHFVADLEHMALSFDEKVKRLYIPEFVFRLHKVGVGLGWDPNANGGENFDLDASAFMLGKNKKTPADKFFVFYNNPVSQDGAVSSSGDDRTGGNSTDGDDETLTVNLDSVAPSIEEIVFIASIYEAEKRRQNFGQVRNAYIRIYNAETNEEIARYDLEEDFSIETVVEFGRLYRRS